MPQGNTGFITAAINQSNRLQELEKNISNDFYQPLIELIEFTYDKNIPKNGFYSLTFQDLVDIYTLAGKNLETPDPRAYAEITEISLEEGSHKIYEFCCHRGAPNNSIDILYKPEEPWSLKHTEKIAGELDLWVGSEDVFCLHVGTIYTVYPLSITAPY
jgi:hypothetical protein